MTMILNNTNEGKDIMKRILVFLLVAALVVSAAACGQRDGQPGISTGSETLESVDFGDELSGEITVSSYETMQIKDFLESAAQTFEEKHPGTKINVETFAAMPEMRSGGSGGVSFMMARMDDDEQARSDYINKVNTEIMGGGGADVLVMDILPYYRYADNSQLVDLAAYMDADPGFVSDDYRMNVIEATKYKGKQYIMPLDYTFSYYAYDSSLFDETERQILEEGAPYTYERLFEMGAEAFERVNANSAEPVRMFGASAFSTRQSNLFNEMFKQDYGKYIDIENRKVNFSDGSFENLLETVMNYDTKGYLRPTTEVGGSIERDMTTIERMRDERFFFKANGHSALLTMALQSLGSMLMTMAYGGIAGGNTDDDVVLGSMSGSDGNVNFSYQQAYGINSNSGNKLLAWAFIKHLLSHEVQSSVQLSRMSLPVNNAAMIDSAKLMLSGQLFSQNGRSAPGFGGERVGGAQVSGAQGDGANVLGEEAASEGENASGEGSTDKGGEVVGGERVRMTTGEGAEGAEGAVSGDGAPTDEDTAGGAEAVSGGGGPAQMMEFVIPDMSDVVLTDEQQKALDEYLDVLNTLADEINYYPIQDQTISTLIENEVAGYFDGTRTAAEVIDTLQNRVNLYLNE